MTKDRHVLSLSAVSGLVACAGPPARPGGAPVSPPLTFAKVPVHMPPRAPDGFFTMSDGARLPYRTWLPAESGQNAAPWAVVLALHGMNDSRDAWEVPAPAFTSAGVALFAPDQRGFGEAPGRGHWAGTPTMVDDAATMARALRSRFPTARLFLMGESMGGAVLMQLATVAEAPPVDGYILVAPAVWGRAEMNIFLRTTLWLADQVVPRMSFGAGPIRVRASDNIQALIRLSTDPLTLHETRVDALKGLVDLMDAALAAAPAFKPPSLFLYGGKDELVPARATAATWRGLDATDTRTAYYPGGYHLLLRDLARAVPIADVLAWMRAPTAPLPSGADRAAQTWLAAQA